MGKNRLATRKDNQGYKTQYFAVRSDKTFRVMTFSEFKNEAKSRYVKHTGSYAEYKDYCNEMSKLDTRSRNTKGLLNLKEKKYARVTRDKDGNRIITTRIRVK